MKKKKFPRWLLVTAMIALLGVFGFSGYKVVTIYSAYHEADHAYADLQTLVGHDDAASEPVETPAPGATATQTGERIVIVMAEPLPTSTPAPTVEPTVTPEPLIQMDFAPLLAINEDAVGWIYSEDTVIDYPIVLGDDNVFYLDHLFSGKWGFAGTIFMDVDNRSDFSDYNTVIYGHHLKNGQMFASISNYRNQKYYDEHPVMYLYTPTGDYEIQIFSAYARDASAIPHDFDTPEEYMSYIDQITKLSDFTTDVTVGPEDRIISLVTCSYVTDNARFVVHGKLVPLHVGDEGKAVRPTETAPQS